MPLRYQKLTAVFQISQLKFSSFLSGTVLDCCQSAYRWYANFIFHHRNNGEELTVLAITAHLTQQIILGRPVSLFFKLRMQDRGLSEQRSGDRLTGSIKPFKETP